MRLSKQKKSQMLSILADVYQGAGTALEYESPFQLLVATILSAQTTDAQVNRATRSLFADYPDLQSMAGITAEDLIPYIRVLGFFRVKAKNIASMAEMLRSQYGGEVPSSREDLMKLPGVGRKTANVVLSNAFGRPAIAVDTHVFRVSRRMGLAGGETPAKVEAELCALIPERDWADAHHWLIWHGRGPCKAQKPGCAECPVGLLCPKIDVDAKRSDKH